MKRLALVAAAVVSMLGVGLLVTPSAQAADDCGGIRAHIYLGTGADVLDLCLPDDLLGG